MQIKKERFIFFNQQLKEQFIQTYESSTQNNLRYLFQKSYNFERLFNKDLFEFSTNELDQLFKSFSSISYHGMASRISIVIKYIDYCIRNGYSDNSLNLAKGFYSREKQEEYVNKIAQDKKFIDEEQLKLIEDFCVNSQDALIFRLLFESVKGENLEELINLKISDCDFDSNTLLLTKNSGENRMLLVSDTCMDLIQEASSQKIYYKNNGEVKINIRAEQCGLAASDYILRPCSKERLKISQSVLNHRLKKIAELYDNPYLTPTNIWFSGMIHYGKILKQKHKQQSLNKEDYLEICIRFSYNSNNWSLLKARIEEYI